MLPLQNMKGLASLLLLAAGAGCAATASPRPIAVPPTQAVLAGSGHNHDCIAAAESAWASRERGFDRAAADKNAMAMQREPEKGPAADLAPFDEAAAERARADLDTTARIRRALLDDGSLSFSAKNVKILTREGKVTLRGVVEHPAERSAVENLAEGVAGDGNVENLL